MTYQSDIRSSVPKLVDKILLIDGSNFLHRNLNQPQLDDLEYNGQKTGAIFGFMRSLLASMKRYPDHYPVVVFDLGRSPRRLSIYPNYKRQQERDEERKVIKEEIKHGIRPESDATDPFFQKLVYQGNAIKEILQIMKLPVINFRGWEGDDLIAIISRHSTKCVIATDDVDMWQLITPRVSVFRPLSVNKETGHKGVEIDWKYMIDNHGYAPIRQFIVTKSILGDGSDNIPKVADGVGGKNASVIADWLVQFEVVSGASLSYMLDQMHMYHPETGHELWLSTLESIKDSISARRYESFLNGLDQLAVNMKLMDLSIIDNDPIVTRELSLQMEACSFDATFVEVIMVLGKYGIKDFDYSSMLAITSSLKHIYRGESK